MNENTKSEIIKHVTQTLKTNKDDIKTKELYQIFEEFYNTCLSKTLSCKEINTVLDCVRIAINDTPLSKNDGKALIDTLRRYVCCH